MLLMPCRRKMWVWRLGSRPIYKERRSEGLGSRAARTVRKIRQFFYLHAPLLAGWEFIMGWIESYSVVALSLYNLCIISNLHAFLLNATIKPWPTVLQNSVCCPSYSIFIWWSLSRQCGNLTVGCISCTLFSSLGKTVEIFYFTLHERWLTCPQRMARGILPLEAF